jgi:signal transduction histidine kinase
MREALCQVPLFAGLSDEDLDHLAAGVFIESFPPGTIVFAEGDDGDRACVITQGEVEVVKVTGSREVLLAVRGPGDVIGEMALLDSAPRMASIRARSEVTFLSIPKQVLDELLATSATAARSLFGVLLSRWRETEVRLRQSERMAQIGTLTAGLAHEMNNPAAAVRRGAGQLGAAVARLGGAAADLERLGLGPDRKRPIEDLLTAARGAQAPLSALERSDREAAVEDTLADLAVADSWRLAPEVVAAGIDPDALRAAVKGLEPQAVTTVVEALGATAEAASLVREVEEGATRLSDIVGALKSYSHLDRAPLQEVDVRRGIDDTLLILRRKVDGIDIRRDYPAEPIVIQAYAAELNQVWTNLIDNAADALTDHDVAEPVIIIRVLLRDDGVVVEVEDNGPGIPPDVAARVFDAFFTTKPPGSGTGLGLDISYGIVVHRHRGEITVDSVPGRTTFRVVLPSNPDA